jgi:hypothetical protein
MERWYLLRLVTDTENLDEEAVSAALTAAEAAADEASPDLPGRWKAGPEIDSYVVSRRAVRPRVMKPCPHCGLEIVTTGEGRHPCAYCGRTNNFPTAAETMEREG